MTIVTSPPSSLVLLYVGDNGPFSEGQLVTASLGVVIKSSNGDWFLFFVVECEVDRMVVDGVLVWVLVEGGREVGKEGEREGRRGEGGGEREKEREGEGEVEGGRGRERGRENESVCVCV